MAIVKSLNRTDIFELKDHRDNTSGELVKCYTLSQLSYMDGIDTRAVRRSGKYLPVRVDTGTAIYKFKKGENKRPYMTFYIRLDEIRDLFKKRNKGKNLIIE